MDLRRGHHRRVPRPFLSVSTWAFQPKCHVLPFFVEVISGFRSPALFFVDRDAAIIGASTIVPVWTIRPCALR